MTLLDIGEGDQEQVAHRKIIFFGRIPLDALRQRLVHACIAPLHDIIVLHAIDVDAVIPAFPSEPADIGDMDRRETGCQFDINLRPVVKCHHQQIFRQYRPPLSRQRLRSAIVVLRGPAWRAEAGRQRSGRALHTGFCHGRRPCASPRSALVATACQDMRSGGRVVEGARLESVYRATPYRGFESHPLRHLTFPRKSLIVPKLIEMLGY